MTYLGAAPLRPRITTFECRALKKHVEPVGVKSHFNFPTPRRATISCTCEMFFDPLSSRMGRWLGIGAAARVSRRWVRNGGRRLGGLGFSPRASGRYAGFQSFSRAVVARTFFLNNTGVSRA
jgi:hypothetical protein